MRNRMLLITLACLVIVLAGCGRGDFNRVGDALKIDAALGVAFADGDEAWTDAVMGLLWVLLGLAAIYYAVVMAGASRRARQLKRR